MKRIFDDFTLQYELIRTMGHVAFDGADIGECLETAGKIDESDRESWYWEWRKTAELNKRNADDCLNNGNIVSARTAYLRASNYYRTAEFFLRDKNELETAIETARMSSYSFEKACKLFQPEYKRIQIPFEKSYLPGYYFKANYTNVKKPTIIAMTGYDGTAEELYFNIGAAGIARGYNVLTFDGPGQGMALREQKLPFRPDWEKVVTQVVDYLIEKEEVDADRIAMIGYSMGGYLVARAAAFEHRIVACIANSGIYSFFDGIMGEKAHSPEFLRMLDKENAQEFNAGIRQMTKGNLSTWWKIQNGLFTFQIKTPQELMNAYRAYTLEDCVNNISCPVLICDSQEEHFLGNQAHILFDKLKCKKEFMYFTKEEGASLHCQCGAEKLSGNRILDWLDNLLK